MYISSFHIKVRSFRINKAVPDDFKYFRLSSFVMAGMNRFGSDSFLANAYEQMCVRGNNIVLCPMGQVMMLQSVLLYPHEPADVPGYIVITVV